VKDAERGRLVWEFNPADGLERPLPLGRKNVAQELTQRLVRGHRNRQPPGRAVGEHLGLEIGPETQLVGSLSDHNRK
jgi:hypothetical protein